MSETAPSKTAASPRSARGGMIRSSLIFSGLTLISRFMGLARDLVITARLGASLTPAADAYNTMLAFPNLFRRIFAEGAFAAAFVPAYARTLEAEGQEAADRLASDALAGLAAVTLLITVAAQLAMPWLMVAINPGFLQDPVKFKLAVSLTQISMPYLPCMAVGALLAGVLNARGRFIVSGAFPILLNLAMLAAVWPQSDPIRGAWAASWATLAAGVSQAGLLLWGARRAGARIRPVRPRLTPQVKALIGLAIPGTVAASATQINIFVSGNLASFTPGARSWLAVADRLYQLPLGLVGVAIGVALLPRLSKALGVGDDAEAQTATDQALVFSLALTLPAAAALIAMPFFLIDGLFTRGAFTPADARATAAALFHYGWGVPAFVLIRILSPAFFARQDTKTPMRYALIGVAVNIGAGLALYFGFGFWGLAAATSLAAWINVALLAGTLINRGLWRPSARAWGKVLRVAAASGGMGLVLALASHYRPLVETAVAGLPLGGKELAVLLVCAGGAAVYTVLLLALGGVTLGEARAALRRGKAAADLPGATDQS